MKTILLFYARTGLLAKAVLYLAIGVITALAAYNIGGFKAGSFTLMNFLAETLHGRILLILWALALSGYVFWRVYESIEDNRGFGKSVGGIAERIGFGFGGLVYGFLLVSALIIACNPNSSSWFSDTDVKGFMQTNLGKIIICGIALGMLGATLNEFYIALTLKFRKTIAIERLNSVNQSVFTLFGVLGYASRGITLGIASFLLWDSAFTTRSVGDTSKEAAFSVMEYLFGNKTLGVIAIGFIIYALYVFVEVRYRKIEAFN